MMTKPNTEETFQDAFNSVKNAETRQLLCEVKAFLQKAKDEEYEELNTKLTAHKAWLQTSENRVSELRQQLGSQWLVIEQLVNILTRKLL